MGEVEGPRGGFWVPIDWSVRREPEGGGVSRGMSAYDSEGIFGLDKMYEWWEGGKKGLRKYCCRASGVETIGYPYSHFAPKGGHVFKGGGGWGEDFGSI